MHAETERKPGHRLGWLIAVSTLGLVLIVVSVVAVISLLSRDTRQDINLADLVDGSTDIVALEGMRDATAELCAQESGCLQGYQTEHVELFKFSSRDGATEYVGTLSDGYQSNWIVINYTDSDLSNTDRREVQEYIDSLATSD